VRRVREVVAARCVQSARERGVAVRLTAKADYACRAMVELATATAATKGERLSAAQGIPLKFLENILLDLKHAGLVESQRGNEGGYRLARQPSQISLADIIRAVDGPLANVRGQRPETLEYAGSAQPLLNVWIALRANVRAVLEAVTLADVAGGELPAAVLRLVDDPEAWKPH
jgi:Rrf2 family protein